MKLIALLFFLIFFKFCVAQISWEQDDGRSKHEAGFGKFKSSIKSTIIFDGNVGLKISRIRNSLSLTTIFSNTATKYYGINWTNNKNYKSGLYGINAGFDIDFSVLHIGLNGLAQTYFNEIKYYFIPNFGFSWWGTLGIFYGFKIMLNEEDFRDNEDYQIGVKYNFTKDLKKEFMNGVDF